ncbi:MAG: heat-inducible transcription repressor HrcA [Clostridiales bacterium]|nr:heat-inducible transcription repressor HrcA [Clostridiales bacterium]
MELSERKIKILQIAVEEFIKDSAPITSGSVKDRTSLEVSTATLRAELNALEAMGFLKQLHTSGGRVPTAQGYRFYVENLLKNIKATNTELEDVRKLIENRTQSLSEIVSGIAKIISKATNYPTVVLVNGIENLVLQEFKIIPLLDEKSMVLIGTNYGYITNTMDVSASAQNCEDASNYLTKYFRGETMGFMLENIGQFKKGMQGEIKAFQNVVDNIVLGLSKLNKQKLLKVQADGVVDLVEKEQNEAKKVLKTLNNEEALIEVLDSDEQDISAVVADDNGEKCSVVKAPIIVGGNKLASIGVFGPQKMDYMGIASALKVVIDELNKQKGE